MTLYEQIYNEVSKTLCEDDAKTLATSLSTMHHDLALRLMLDAADSRDNSESDMGAPNDPR